jgi:mRNA interferase RelE/StbE
MEWTIIILPQAQSQLAAIKDRRIRSGLDTTISRLAHDPEKQGKPLRGKLANHYSIRAIGQRFRIVYRIDEGTIRVLVVTVGLRREGSRKDVYAQAERLADAGTLDNET